METLRSKINSRKVLLTLLGILVLVACYQCGPQVKWITEMYEWLVIGIVGLVGGYGMVNVGAQAVVQKFGKPPTKPKCPACGQEVK